MRHYIIYIPGLGDGYDPLRRLALFFWRIFGVTVEYVPMKWYDGKPYDEKYRRVEAAVRNAQALGFTVSLIGESAGATMAMNVFARNKSLHRMVSLCGVNSGNTPISPKIFKRSPGFQQSVSLVNESRAKVIKSRHAQVTSVIAMSDSTVPPEKNTIPGARQVKIWTMGHIFTITLCLSVLSFVIVRQVRRVA